MNQIWRKILPLLLLSVLVCKSNCESDRSAKGLLVNRTGAIVKINSQCIPNDGIGIGTCMRRRDCIKDNGNVTGTCDKGQICCKSEPFDILHSWHCFIHLCFDLATVEKCANVAAKRFNLVRPPSKSLTDCTYTISAFSSRVCQLKIEFTELTLAAPEIDSNGTMECRREVLLIDDVAMDFCGNNDNQHGWLNALNYWQKNITNYPPFILIALVFVEFDAKSKSKKELKFKLDPKEESQWYLSVTQLECPLDPSPISRWQPIRTALSYFHFGRTGGSLISSLQHSSNVGDIHELAPAGCLQYFTEPKGVVSSFNYVDGMYLPDMDYAICIKRKPANKQLRYLCYTFDSVLA